MPRPALALTVLGLLAFAAGAREASPYQEAVAAFDRERTEAKATPAELASADDLAARAKAANEGGNVPQALRLMREARRAVPVPAAALPEGVARVVGGGRFRHADRVTGVSFSPDGRRLATASRDGTVKVWNLDNGRELLTYRGHRKGEPDGANVLGVPNVAFAPDGQTVASSGGKVLHVWDAATGVLKQTLAGHAAPARGLAFTPDGKHLVSGGDDRKVIVWDLAAGKPKVTYPDQASRVEAVAVSAGKGASRLIATVNGNGELLVYPFADEPRPHLLGVTVTDGGEGGFGVAFVGETPNVLTCGGDPRVKLTTGPEPGAAVSGVGTAARVFAGHAGKVTTLAATPDGTRFVTGSADRTVRVWETATGKPLATFTSAALPPTGETREVGVSAVGVSPDGQYVAAGTVEGVLHLWPMAADDESRKSTDAADPLWAVAASPGGRTYATAGADKLVRVYDAATGKLLKTLTGHAAAAPALAYLTDTALVSGSGDKLVKLWDTATGRATDLAGHTSAVLAVATVPAEKRVYSGGLDREVRAWDAAGKPLWTWAAASPVTALAARPDGRRLAVGTADGTLTILSVPAAGDPVKVGATVAHGNGVAAAAFHPDGVRLLTAGGDGLAKLWTVHDAAAPTLLARLEPNAATKPGVLPVPGMPAVPMSVAPPSPLSAAAFSPDGRLFALGGADAAVRLWGTASLAEVRAFRGHADWVTAVAFTADGRAVLSASADKTLRRFDVPRAESAADAGHTGTVQAVAVSPNGKLLATGGRDRAVKVWSLADGKLLATLTGSAASVTALAFTADDTLASTGNDGRVRWWGLTPQADGGGGRELRNAATGTGPGQMNFSLHADPKTGRVASVGSRADATSACDVFDAGGKPLAQVVDRGRTPSCATVSADLGLVATAGEDGNVRLWDLATRERVGADWPLTKAPVRDMAFSPDGSKLVAIDANGALRIATVKDRAAGEPFPGGPGPMGVVAAPAGDRFGVFFDDGTVKTWTLAGKPLQTWKLPAPATSLTFTPDGATPVVGLSDGSAAVLK